MDSFFTRSSSFLSFFSAFLRREVSPSFFSFFIVLHSFRNILDREQNRSGLRSLLHDRPGIEQHLLPSDTREFVVDHKITDLNVFGKDLFEKFPKRRNVPLTTAELIDEFLFGICRSDPEGLIE